MFLADPAANAAIVAICTASFLEGTGVPWPGVYIVAGAAAMLDRSVPNIALVAGLVAASYTLGALVQYAIGYLFGETALSWLPTQQRTKLNQMAERYGAALVCWSRPLAIGNYVSLPAGLVRMPLPRFIAYTVAGILPWGIGATLAGQAVGARIGGYLSKVTEWMLPAAIVLGAAALIWAAWKWRPTASAEWRRACSDNQTHNSRG